MKVHEDMMWLAEKIDCGTCNGLGLMQLDEEPGKATQCLDCGKYRRDLASAREIMGRLWLEKPTLGLIREAGDVLAFLSDDLKRIANSKSHADAAAVKLAVRRERERCAGVCDREAESCERAEEIARSSQLWLAAAEHTRAAESFRYMADSLRSLPDEDGATALGEAPITSERDLGVPAHVLNRHPEHVTATELGLKPGPAAAPLTEAGPSPREPEAYVPMWSSVSEHCGRPPAPPPCSTCGATSRDDPRGRFCSDGFHGPLYVSVAWGNAIEKRIEALESAPRVDEALARQIANEELACDVRIRDANIACAGIEPMREGFLALQERVAEVERYIDEMAPKPERTTRERLVICGKCSYPYDDKEFAGCLKCPPAASGRLGGEIAQLLQFLKDNAEELPRPLSRSYSERWASAVEALQAENERLRRDALREAAALARREAGECQREHDDEETTEEERHGWKCRRAGALSIADRLCALAGEPPPAPEPLPEWFIEQMRMCARGPSMIDQSIKLSATEWRALLAWVEKNK